MTTQNSHQLNDNDTVRLEDYVNDQLQTYTDLEGLDALLESVKAQQGLLRKQLQEAETLSRNSHNSIAQHVKELRQSTTNFEDKQRAIDRRLLILTGSDAGKDALSQLAPFTEKLQQLDIAEDMMGLLGTVHSLSNQTKSNFKNDPKAALEPYLRIKQISKNLKELQPPAEYAAPHLIDYVNQQASSLFLQMKEGYSSTFETTLKKMKWPGKDLTLEDDLAREWSAGVSKLLDLQKSDLLEQEARDYQSIASPQSVLLPLQIMVGPLELRFKYHFSGDKATNRLDKPELFLSHITNLVSTYEEFLATYLQPVLTEHFRNTILSLNSMYMSAVSAFITALLPMLRQKLSHILPQISTQPQLFSHLIHELLSFDRDLRDEWSYGEGTTVGMWKGLTWEVLDRNSWDWFPKWLQVERDFAMTRYEAIINQRDGGELDTESVDAGITKPTKSAFRVNDLLENITDRYRDLPSFYQKVQFLISIQITIFDKFHERLHSSLEAYLAMTSSVGRTVQGVTKEEQMQLQGIQGLERLCRIYGSSEYLERKMQDWSEDVFFLEVWDEIQYLNNNRAENGNSVGGTLTFEQIAERTSKGLGNEDDRGGLFDETKGAYQRLRIRTEGVILDVLTHSMKEGLRPFGRLSAWATSSPDPSTEVNTSHSAEIDTAIETLNKDLSFLSNVLSDLSMRRIGRQLAVAVQTWIWDNIVMRHRFSASGSKQLQNDVTTLERTFCRYAGAKSGRLCMQRLCEATQLLNLPAKQAPEEASEDAWDVDEEAREHDTQSATNINDVERKVFHSNESAREVLEELGMEALSEGDARNVLSKRIDLES